MIQMLPSIAYTLKISPVPVALYTFHRSKIRKNFFKLKICPLKINEKWEHCSHILTFDDFQMCKSSLSPIILWSQNEKIQLRKEIVSPNAGVLDSGRWKWKFYTKNTEKQAFSMENACFHASFSTEMNNSLRSSSWQSSF